MMITHMMEVKRALTLLILLINMKMKMRSYGPVKMKVIVLKKAEQAESQTNLKGKFIIWPFI